MKRTTDESKFWGYKYAVKKGVSNHNGRKFELTEEQFIKLVTDDCAICGKKPTKKHRGSNADSMTLFGGTTIPKQPMNTIDQMIPRGGYIEGNVQTLCETCNHKKKDKHMTEDLKAKILISRAA